MKQITYTKEQRVLLAQLSLPMPCVHEVYGAGTVTQVIIPEGVADLLLMCSFRGNSKLGFLYSKLNKTKLQIPKSQYELLDRLFRTVPDFAGARDTKKVEVNPGELKLEPVGTVVSAVADALEVSAQETATSTVETRSVKRARAKRTMEPAPILEELPVSQDELIVAILSEEELGSDNSECSDAEAQAVEVSEIINSEDAI